VAVSPVSRLESVEFEGTGNDHAAPSPIPFLDAPAGGSSLRHEDGHGGRGRERERPDVDKLLNLASQVSPPTIPVPGFVLTDAPLVRSPLLHWLTAVSNQTPTFESGTP
jgi:hypothetical protein